MKKREVGGREGGQEAKETPYRDFLKGHFLHATSLLDPLTVMTA
jgi:hypothetical protein